MYSSIYEEQIKKKSIHHRVTLSFMNFYYLIETQISTDFRKEKQV